MMIGFRISHLLKIIKRRSKINNSSKNNKVKMFNGFKIGMRLKQAINKIIKLFSSNKQLHKNLNKNNKISLSALQINKINKYKNNQNHKKSNKLKLL